MISLVETHQHAKSPYDAKDFDEQQGYKFRFDTDDGAPLEVGVYLHWKSGAPVDIAIDLSCMSGCTERCTFCAAAGPNNVRKILTPDQIVAQATTALEHVGHAHPEFVESIKKNGVLTLSFEGMGEPTRCPEEIRQSIERLRGALNSKFRTQFIISTTLADPNALVPWQMLDLHSLQVSLHAASDKARNALLGTRYDSISTLFAAIGDFATGSPKTQIKINYLLLKDVNDTTEHLLELARLIKDKPYFLKLSRLNETIGSRDKKYTPAADNTFAMFKSELERLCPENTVYIYGSRRTLEMSCGQLAAYASTECPKDVSESIAALYPQIADGNMILFLGAGASRTAWDAKGLANTLYSQLGYRDPLPAGFGLGEIADI